LVDKTPKEAFNAINNVRGWWSEEIEGSTDKLNDEFKYHFEDIHRYRIKLIEFIPDKKVVWLVMQNYFKPGIFDDASDALRSPRIWPLIRKRGQRIMIPNTIRTLVPSLKISFAIWRAIKLIC
jgi:hypothetical protein